MGITNDSLKRLNRLGLINGSSYRMLELGCQNIYDNDNYFGVTYGMIAKNFFIQKNIEHISFDITGCQCSEKVDLRENVDIKKYGLFDVITDYGTTEHIDNTELGGFYEGFKNIHQLCKVGGYMIHETPLTGHWIGHGFNYVTTEFYKSLAKDMDYTIIELDIHFCFGNYTDGGLVCCVLKKNSDNKFISRDIFKNYDIRSK
jgi:hypothetical protein